METGLTSDSDWSDYMDDDQRPSWEGSSRSGGSASAAGRAKKPPLTKKRAKPAGGAAGGAKPAAKKPKGAKAKVNLSWTDSEEEESAGAAAKAAGGAEPRAVPWTTWVKKPPATMSFSGNLATQPPLYWAGKQGGREAANLLDTMENCRLIGTIDLEFEGHTARSRGWGVHGR